MATFLPLPTPRPPRPRAARTLVATELGPARRADHPPHPLRARHPGAGPPTDRYGRVPGGSRARRTARTPPRRRLPLAGPGRPRPLAQPALLLRVGRLRRGPHSHRRQQLRDEMDSDDHRGPDQRGHPGRHRHSPDRRGVRESRRRTPRLPVPQKGLHRDRRRGGDRRGHRHRLRVHREHPLPGHGLRHRPAHRRPRFTSVTAATFFVRIVMSPFAHPLFTVLTGIGFGIAAHSSDRHHVRRVLVP